MNLWVLTEERPKINIISQIVKLTDINACISNIAILPLFNNGQFTFTYQVFGVQSNRFNSVFIKTVSGYSSFFDFMVFYQPYEPIEFDNIFADRQNNNLIFLVEETKTNDNESRNVSAYQRASKFIYAEYFYPNIPKYMLYNYSSLTDKNATPTLSNIFGTNLLLTLNTNYLGKNMNNYFQPFTSLDEMIKFKNEMPNPTYGQAVKLVKHQDKIEISGVLSKPFDKGNINHDPNIGLLPLISAVIRHFGWKGKIIITDHGVKQTSVNNMRGNKFLYLASILGIDLDRILLPIISIPKTYWKYERNKEKIASIFFHILTEGRNNEIKCIFENHGGCERGYFYDLNNLEVEVSKNYLIPDLVLLNAASKSILIIEGKTYEKLSQGLYEIENYDDFIKDFITKYYPNYNVEKWITLYGSTSNQLPHEKVILLINIFGQVIYNLNSPDYIKQLFLQGGASI